MFLSYESTLFRRSVRPEPTLSYFPFHPAKSRSKSNSKFDPMQALLRELQAFLENCNPQHAKVYQANQQLVGMLTDIMLTQQDFQRKSDQIFQLLLSLQPDTQELQTALMIKPHKMLKKELVSAKQQLSRLQQLDRAKHQEVGQLYQQLSKSRSSLSNMVANGQSSKLPSILQEILLYQGQQVQERKRLFLMNLQTTYFQHQRKMRSNFTVLRLVNRPIPPDQIFNYASWSKPNSLLNKIEIGRNSYRLGAVLQPGQSIILLYSNLLKLSLYEGHCSVMRKVTFCSSYGCSIIQPGLAFVSKQEKFVMAFIVINGSQQFQQGIQLLQGWQNQYYRVVGLATRKLEENGLLIEIQVEKKGGSVFTRVVHFYSLQLQEAQTELLRRKKNGVLEKLQRLKVQVRKVIVLNLPLLSGSDEQTRVMTSLVESLRY